jgi:hypothetical protein
VSRNFGLSLIEAGAPLRAALANASGQHKRKYKPTAAIDAVICEAYQRQRGGDRSALKAASRQLNWPHNAVVKRGAELGISRIKEFPWSEAEQQLLERFGHLAPSGIQRRLAAAGFLRSIAAIQVKLHRGRIKQNLNGYSACGLADAFGVDVHKVLNWIRRGLLGAVRRGTARTGVQGGDIWWISRRQVKAFVLRAPEEIDLARVEKIWFLDLLTGGKLCA